MTRSAVKIMNIMMVLFLILPVSNIYAVSDTRPPVLFGVVLSKTEVNPGESTTIYITAIDNLSGVESVSFQALSPSKKQNYTTALVEIDSEGKWYGNIPVSLTAEPGKWIISYITLTDKAGNVANYNYYFDYVAEFTVSDNAPSLIPLKVNEVTDQDSQVSGQATPGSKITVKAGTITLGQGTSAGDGTFSVYISLQKPDTELTILIADKAGNTIEKKMKVKDVTAPVAPDVNMVTDKTKIVTGMAESGSTVVIKKGTTVLAQGIATAEGNFSIGIPVQKPGTVITITSTDKAGNTSKGINIEVKQAITFIDLESVPWAKEAVETMATLGIINGVGDNKYSPDSNVTRAQFAKLIIKTLGITGTANHPFTDVKASDWFSNEVALAYKYGIVNGVSATEFAPDRPITRQEMAVMMVRAMNYKQKVTAKDVNGTLSKYTDRDQIDSWAKEAVAISIEQGLINGMTATTFSPKTNATRAQSAVIMYRFYLKFMK